MAKKRLHPKPHRIHHRDDPERLSLAPLSFEEAVKAALATPKPENADEAPEDDVEAL